MEIGAGAALAGAGIAAASAYIDARYHISKDVAGMWRVRKHMKQAANKAQRGRASLWYYFEDQVRRMGPTEQCIWSRMGCYNWPDTHAMACRYAQFFLTQGLEPGDIVCFYLMNSPEFIFSYLASWAVGSAPALINYNLTGDALIHCLKLSGSKVVVVDEDADCRSRIEDVRSRIEGELGMRIVIMDKDIKQTLTQTEPKRPERKYRENVTGSFPMCLMYTSGTTGMPKACSFPMERIWNISAYRQESNGLKTGPGGDRWYDCMPMYHGTGNTVAVGCLTAGMTLCIGRKFSTSRFWDDVRESGATTFVYVGETARYLLNAPPSSRDKDHKVQSAWGNGMRPDVWERFRERFGIPHIIEFFNSSEGVFHLYNFNSGPFTAAAVGHHGLITRYQLRNAWIPVAIDHEKGDIWRHPETGFAKRSPYEEGGEIIIKIPTEAVFTGYWNNPKATESKFLRNVFEKGDLYYRTGDALRRVDGKWYFMDRLGDTFRWKGENVSTAEVAEHMGRYPGVAEANVYGVELPSHDGRAGCAALYIDPSDRQNFDYRGLLQHCRKSLPRYAVPLFVRIIHEQNLGHNNKQNKAPYRKEGVHHESIAAGQVGPNDTILWVPPKGESYEPFTPAAWNDLVVGKARL